MEFFKSTLNNKKPDTDVQSTSLLAEWNKYQGTEDVESGHSSISQEGLLRTVDAAGAGLSSLLKSSYDKVSTGVAAINPPSFQGATALLPSQQQLVYCFSFIAAGLLFLALAFFIFLPTIILSPSKFALAFTMGCCCVMSGFAILRGWKQQVQHMFSTERLPFSAAYVGSIFATLYSALIMKSYLLSLFCSGLQMIALVYYVLSYFPGGATGVQFILGMFWTAVSSCFSSLARSVLR